MAVSRPAASLDSDASPDPEAMRVVVDPLTGRPILMAPKRRHRPRLTESVDDGGSCPFCPGHEAETPPASDLVTGEHGWTARAFPNLYPASPWHEVVAEGAVHADRPSRLEPAVWRDVVRLHRRRVRELEAADGVACAFLFKNVGHRAGASIGHNHTQVLGLPMLPPRLALLVERARQAPCVICADVAAAEAEQRLVWRDRTHAVVCPRAPKTAHETWLVPLAHEADWLDDDGGATGTALHRLLVALDAALEAPPFNLVLLRAARSPLHWHYEVVVREAGLAGLEVGGDMYINITPPQETAARLRSACDR